ncbi:MAG TPA: hypothetical protein VLA46_11800, partial [Saprospiraceae bacterium]|nr:hypothetical protein [Saprospiraceae bacterium]
MRNFYLTPSCASTSTSTSTSTSALASALAFSFAFCLACNTPMKEETALYTSESFTLYKDSVVQGNNVARILSPTHITSNYRSPASSTFSRLIKFKISINEKDNEMPPGSDHWVLIGDEHESPVVKFGEPPQPLPEMPSTYLPVNYEYTFRVDMSSVLKQFEEKGYFEAYDGSRVAKNDFKGFYVAGASLPLSWDFVGLDEKGLKLQPTDEPGIYMLTVKFNPYNEEGIQDKEWQLSTDISNRARYTSAQPIVDALFNLSVEEATKNIEADSTFRTGAKWGGVWTRDISYSIILAFAYHEPEVAKISLRKKVNRGRIVQDTGSGGAWPVSSDRVVWAIAAWEIYKVTGEQAWLDEIYPIIKNSLEDDYKTLHDPETGLYAGESSFLDWREQTYPKWMSNMDIAVSQNLGTNVLHYRANKIMAEMAALKGESDDAYTKRAEDIKAGINQYLWLEDKGYYAQYRYGRPHLTISPRFEALGEALAVLFDVPDADRAATIISRSPVTEYGVTCIYPQIPGIPPYHNNAIWPFVQAYWNLAAAKTGNEEVLVHGLASIYRAGAFFLTNYENMVAQTGDFLGTEINSDRMLWSMAGNLAMVYRVFMGMSFETDGLHFQPVVPEVYGGARTLSNFKYRQASLDITITGHGNVVQKISMDGSELKDGFVPAGLTGSHTIEIELTTPKTPMQQKGIHKVANHFTLVAPRVEKDSMQLKWGAIEKAKAYHIYRNGKFLEHTTTTAYTVPAGPYAEYKVSAVDEMEYESFTSEPVAFTPSETIVEFENIVPASRLPYTNYSGLGFVEISQASNRIIECKVNIAEAGEYYIDARYSNGSGPWNTDNKCAVRSLTVNDVYAGVLIFPQRGQDEWSDWGFSNSRKVKLKAGENIIRLTFEDWNNNMNVDVNTAMVDYMRVI